MTRIIKALWHPIAESPSELRRRAEIATGNVEGGFQRLLSEPARQRGSPGRAFALLTTHNDFRDWGRAAADLETGVYWFETVRPGAVRGRHDRQMAPNVNVWIVARNIGLNENECTTCT